MRNKPIIEDVLDKIRCPQFGYDDYGEWGALSFHKRLKIKELCDYAKSLEKYYEEQKKKESKNMKSETFMNVAKELTKKFAEVENDVKLKQNDVYIVWYNYTLGNSKALLSTNIEDGRYYEVTYNKEKSEIYIDIYKKEHNECVGVKIV